MEKKGTFGLSVSEAADLLEFSHGIISKGLQSLKENKAVWTEMTC